MSRKSCQWYSTSYTSAMVQLVNTRTIKKNCEHLLPQPGVWYHCWMALFCNFAWDFRMGLRMGRMYVVVLEGLQNDYQVEQVYKELLRIRSLQHQNCITFATLRFKASTRFLKVWMKLLLKATVEPRFCNCQENTWTHVIITALLPKKEWCFVSQISGDNDSGFWANITSNILAEQKEEL